MNNFLYGPGAARGCNYISQVTKCMKIGSFHQIWKLERIELFHSKRSELDTSKSTKKISTEASRKNIQILMSSQAELAIFAISLH